MFIVCLSTFQSLNNHRKKNSTKEEKYDVERNFSQFHRNKFVKCIQKCVEFSPNMQKLALFFRVFRFVRCFSVLVDATEKELINILNFPFI
jgi:hypothetical protein